ncbi:MAG: O-antigen ligase family protein [Nitrospira sp.]|nr:O-antigen ligase family protein [Nitrospira sp.]
MQETVLPVIRYAFYLFVFVIPFENASTETAQIIGSIPMLVGVALTGAAVLQPRICFNVPPVAFWCFVGYVVVCFALGMTENLDYWRHVLKKLITLAQLLLLMWISFNLLRYPEICRNALMLFVAACAVLSIFQIVGIGTVAVGQGRSSLFADNANTVGGTLSLALIALVGITYGRITAKSRISLLAWIVFPIMGTAIIMTGSRGSLLGLVFGIALLIIRDGNWETKLKIASIAVLAIGFLVLTALSDDAMRARLERSMYQGDLAGRDTIQAHAWGMFFERPILGWGPVYNAVELGSRMGKSVRDPHSLYLTVLTETGSLGAILFFGGLGLIGRAAWQARAQIEGSLPMAMLSCLLTLNLSGSWQNRKIFWLLLAYVLASAWPIRKISRHGSSQFPEPIEVNGQEAGTVASYPQANRARSREISAQPERPA